MAIIFRQYKPDGLKGDYTKVWNLLRDIDDEVGNPYTISWVRWEWCRSHTAFDKKKEGLTGLWEEEGRLVAAVCYEMVPGDVFFNLRKGYEYLLEEMWDYAVENLGDDGNVNMVIPDAAEELQRLALKKGYVATNDKEQDAILDIECTDLNYNLPEGFSITSQNKDYDIKQYASVLWNGFGHANEGPVDVSDQAMAAQEYMLSGPHNDLSLKIVVKNSEGEYVSYAALWYDKNQEICTIEPCATHPDYRRMGLGKAAIYEGIRRCAKKGAKKCLVGSDQDFYYRIGFAPFGHRTYWKK